MRAATPAFPECRPSFPQGPVGRIAGVQQSESHVRWIIREPDADRIRWGKQETFTTGPKGSGGFRAAQPALRLLRSPRNRRSEPDENWPVLPNPGAEAVDRRE